MSIESFIGSKISIITHEELRYEGRLFNLNTEDSSIVLENVRCMGTEMRGKNGEVPPSNTVHDYMVFKADDIKDISVSEVQQVEPPPVTPYGYQGMGSAYGAVTMDPASSRSMGSQNIAASERSNYAMGGHMGMQPIMNNPFGTMDGNGIGISPYSQDAQSYFRGMPPQHSSLHMNRMMPPQMPDSRANGGMFDMFAENTRKSQIGARNDAAKFGLEDFEFAADPFAETNTFDRDTKKPGAPMYDRPPDFVFKDHTKVANAVPGVPQMGATYGNQRQQMHSKPTDPRASAPVKQTGNISQDKLDKSRKKKEQQGKTTEAKPSVSTAAEHKPQAAAKVDKKPEQHVILPVYNKKSSFFDNLSQETDKHRTSLREERMKQREMNMDTFGEVAVRHGNPSWAARRSKGDKKQNGRKQGTQQGRNSKGAEGQGKVNGKNEKKEDEVKETVAPPA